MDSTAGGPGSAAFAAVDLGASSGRVIVGRVTGAAGEQRIELHEVNRFANTPVPSAGAPVRRPCTGTCWRCTAASSTGCGPPPGRPGTLAGVGIDSWAVDYGLLDADGALLGNPVHYRDGRTNGVPEQVFAQVAGGGPVRPDRPADPAVQHGVPARRGGR